MGRVIDGLGSENAAESNGRGVLVAGATGGTGRQVTERLGNTDMVVRGMTRSRGSVEGLAAIGAEEVAVGDLMNPSDADTAVQGCDDVVCTVGSTPGLGTLFGDLVDGRGVVNLIDAAESEGVDRFVLVSSIGVGDSKAGMPLFLRALLGIAGVLSAKERGENRLRGSDLTHTILRPGGLTDEDATGDVVVGEGGDTVSGSVPRADVGRIASGALETAASENRTFEIVARDGLRGEPSGVVDIEWASVGSPE